MEPYRAYCVGFYDRQQKMAVCCPPGWSLWGREFPDEMSRLQSMEALSAKNARTSLDPSGPGSSSGVKSSMDIKFNSEYYVVFENWHLYVYDDENVRRMHTRLPKAKSNAGEITALINETDRQIDAMVYELYGLTEEEIKIVEKS